MATSSEKIVERYLKRMTQIRSTGGATGETSYYSALENLLNEMSSELRLGVVCNGQLRDQGAGHPDFGLYSKDQCSNGAPKAGQGEIPARGVIEVKSPADDSWKTVQEGQTANYLDLYGHVLVTNYRDFRLVVQGQSGANELEFHSFAEDESSFWQAAGHPKKTAKAHSVPFREFIRRAFSTTARLTRAEDIAWILASHAREALNIVEAQGASTLKPLRKNLEIALGVRFSGAKGDHFFKSTLVQTLFYGMFSAWVVASRKGEAHFDWRTAGFHITVPIIQVLFSEIAAPQRIGALGLMPVLDRAGAALGRIDHEAFFESFESGQAIQHFYEPFLQEFDPELRKDLGVWYTPPEIVHYMVERVDRVLRTELGIQDGLADESVYVLDPCCGTGAYVVEVLRRIDRTLREKGSDALLGEDLKDAACNRIFGFELLPASFTIAHWQVGNLLANADAPLDLGKGERPAIYLTNALTGWVPPTGPKVSLSLFPEMEEERDAAEAVKRKVPILVVLGNPPYNAFAGTSPAEEEGLVGPYKAGLKKIWGMKKYNLDDLYIRFFRIAERRVNETGRGVICYVSNYSYTREQSFVVMRQHLLDSFDKIWIENLHGDRNKTEYAPDGSTSETVFAMPGYSPGIRQGVVVGLAVKTGKSDDPAIVRYRDDIDAGSAAERRNQLVASLDDMDLDERYEVADPNIENRLSFKPVELKADYLSWPTIPDLASIAPINGLMEKRGGALIDIDWDALVNRMQTYFDDSVDWSEFAKSEHPLASDAARFNAKRTRAKILAKEKFSKEQVLRYIVRPFDVRHCYYTGIRPVWNEPRPQLWDQYSGGNRFLMTRKVSGAAVEGPPALYTQCLADDHSIRTDAYLVPFWQHERSETLLDGYRAANLSKRARCWLKELGIPSPDTSPDAAAAPWLHALSITFAPQYLEENADWISIDWPRLPLPKKQAVLDRSAALGTRVAELLDTETAIDGVSTGKVEEHLKVLGVVSDTDLRVLAGWGYLDAMGRVMPGRGKIEARDWTDSELAALCSGFASAGIDDQRAFALIGRAIDVYLNDTTCWRGVPETVWNYFIGGYQVIKKWLSYRQEGILGRPLGSGEAREISAMVRRLTALILLTDELNANYVDCRDNAYDW